MDGYVSEVFQPRRARITPNRTGGRNRARYVIVKVLQHAVLFPRTMSGRSAAWLARLVRDQEVEGSNPFAPTTSKILPFIGLRYFLRFDCCDVLWTNVDQLKAQTDALGPFLPERNILFEL